MFFPDVPGQVITVNLEMDARAPFALTRANRGSRIEEEVPNASELRILASDVSGMVDAARSKPYSLQLWTAMAARRLYAEMLPGRGIVRMCPSWIVVLGLARTRGRG